MASADEKEADRLLALRGPVEEIYLKIGAYRHPRHYNDENRPYLCDDVRIQHPGRWFDERPTNLPFLRTDVQDFHDYLGSKYMQGCWHVPWTTEVFKDSEAPYADDFRNVLSFRTIEFMIRPIKNLKHNSTEPARLHFSWQNVRQCLDAGLYANPHPQMTVKIGRGQIKNQWGGKSAVLLNVDFEWRLDRAQAFRVHEEVNKWKYKQFKGSRNFTRAKRDYDRNPTLRPGTPQAPQQGPTATAPYPPPLPYTPSTQPQQPPYYPAAYGFGPRKRSLMSSEDSESMRSSKRQSYGSESQISPPIPAPNWRQMGPYVESPQTSRASSAAGSSRDSQLVSPEIQSGYSQGSGQPQFPPPEWGVPTAMIPAQLPGGFHSMYEGQMMGARGNVPWPSTIVTENQQFGSPASTAVSSALSDLSLTSQSQGRGTPRPQQYGDDIDTSDFALGRTPGGRPALQPQMRGQFGQRHGSSNPQVYLSEYTEGPRVRGRMPVAYTVQPPVPDTGAASYPSVTRPTGIRQAQSGMFPLATSEQEALSPEEREREQRRFQQAMDDARAAENRQRLQRRMAEQEQGGGNPPIPSQGSSTGYGARWAGQGGSGSPGSHDTSEEYQSSPQDRPRGGRGRRFWCR